MRTLPVAGAGDTLPRGVYVAPWVGPNDEIVLVAITRGHRLAAPPLTIPHGASQIGAADALLALLDRDDPIPNLKAI